MEGPWGRTNDFVSRVGTRGIRSSRLLSRSASITLFLHHDDGVVNLQFVRQSAVALSWLLCRHHRNVGHASFSVQSFNPIFNFKSVVGIDALFIDNIAPSFQASIKIIPFLITITCLGVDPINSRVPSYAIVYVVTYRSHATWLIGNTCTLLGGRRSSIIYGRSRWC